MADNDFERRLAERLRAYEASMPDERAPVHVAPSAGPGRWILGAGVVAAGAAAGILLAAVLLGRPQAPVGDPAATPSATTSETTPTAFPTPTPSASGSPTAAASTTAPTPAGPEPREGWTAVRVAEPGPYVAVNGVAGWTDGLMAYGRSDTTAGAIWLSSDGETWTSAEVPESPPGTAVYVNDVTRAGDRYVAVGTLAHPEGSGPMGAVIWTSPDGRTWTEAEGSAAFRNSPLAPIASSGDSVVAGGLASLWRSADAGSSWTEVTAPGAGGWNISGIGVHDGRFVATGFVGSAYGPQAAAIWTSEDDGATWTQTDLDGDSSTSVAALPDGRLLAVGEGANAVLAWISDDGRTWEPIPVEATCCIVDLAATPSGIIGVGFGPSPGGVTLSTRDGTTWSSQAGVERELDNVIYTDRFGIVAGGANTEGEPAAIFGPHPHP